MTVDFDELREKAGLLGLKVVPGEGLRIHGVFCHATLRNGDKPEVSWSVSDAAVRLAFSLLVGLGIAGLGLGMWILQTVGPSSFPAVMPLALAATFGPAFFGLAYVLIALVERSRIGALILSTCR